jgi:hypothetical protein
MHPGPPADPPQKPGSCAGDGVTLADLPKGFRNSFWKYSDADAALRDLWRNGRIPPDWKAEAQEFLRAFYYLVKKGVPAPELAAYVVTVTCKLPLPPTWPRKPPWGDKKHLDSVLGDLRAVASKLEQLCGHSWSDPRRMLPALAQVKRDASIMYGVDSPRYRAWLSVPAEERAATMANVPHLLRDWITLLKWCEILYRARDSVLPLDVLKHWWPLSLLKFIREKTGGYHYTQVGTLLGLSSPDSLKMLVHRRLDDLSILVSLVKTRPGRATPKA